ncbi:MAG: hypothetical protein SPL49_01960 [Oribacterium sp.]|jgi:hypothetical protein|nr:hypothetical protein [Oribacterium sp.]MDY6308205.1 hypothetical protein [Oribacterium sp.]MDY6315965.1 hypothetical protein [Oribacterium sp.]
MSENRRRSTKRRRKQEATLVGDLFRILLAVSLLIVAILAVSMVFKSVNGFTLPDLRVTAAEIETTAAPIEITAAPETTRETTAAVTTTQAPVTVSIIDQENGGEDVEKAIEAKEKEEGVSEGTAETEESTTGEAETEETTMSKLQQESASPEAPVAETGTAQQTHQNGPDVIEAPMQDTVSVEENGNVISSNGPIG